MRIPKGGIAFFDSGIGGLTVMAQCAKYPFDVPFYYYGDNTHAPYGNLSERKIKRYVGRAFRTFKRLKVRAVVIACNTATAVCIAELRKKYPFPIIGTEPAVFPAAAEGGEVWVLLTRATYNHKRFKLLCERANAYYPQANVQGIPCDGLAGEIERNINNAQYDYTPFLPRGRPQRIVLGCTHYPYIKKQIQAFYQCPIYDGNEGIAKQLYFVYQKSKKNWDERPLEKKMRFFLGRLTTFLKRARKKRIFLPKKRKKIEKSRENKGVFFLGKQRGFNENIYKQMFVFNKNGHE